MSLTKSLSCVTRKALHNFLRITVAFMFQFDLQKTFFRQLNFTRSESGGEQIAYCHTETNAAQNITIAFNAMFNQHHVMIKLISVGTFSVLQVVFLLQRHTGYFLIQVQRTLYILPIAKWDVNGKYHFPTRCMFPALSLSSSVGWAFG